MNCGDEEGRRLRETKIKEGLEQREQITRGEKREHKHKEEERKGSGNINADIS